MRQNHKLPDPTTHTVPASNSTIACSIGCVFKVLYWPISVCRLPLPPHRSQYNPEKINAHSQTTDPESDGTARKDCGQEMKRTDHWSVTVWGCNALVLMYPGMWHLSCNFSDSPLAFHAFCHFVNSCCLLHQLLHLLHHLSRKTNLGFSRLAMWQLWVGSKTF